MTGKEARAFKRWTLFVIFLSAAATLYLGLTYGYRSDRGGSSLPSCGPHYPTHRPR